MTQLKSIEAQGQSFVGYCCGWKMSVCILGGLEQQSSQQIEFNRSHLTEQDDAPGVAVETWPVGCNNRRRRTTVHPLMCCLTEGPLMLSAPFKTKQNERFSLGYRFSIDDYHLYFSKRLI